jgi:enoyl-CoA hydratase/carnithine racemase
MEFETITLAQEGRVATLTLNRPAKRNAMNDRMIQEIARVFTERPGGFEAVVLAGAGPSFSAGLDLSEHSLRSPAEAMQTSALWHRVTGLIEGGGIPVIAALHGHVVGAGLETAASAHIRIAEEGCQFALPEGRRGIFVGGGASVRVSRLVGASRLMEMMLTGRMVDATEALRIGLVHHLVPPGEALARAQAVAATVADNAPLSNLMMLNALPRIAEMAPTEGLFTETLAVALAQTSPEAQARMRDFLERRRS